MVSCKTTLTDTDPVLLRWSNALFNYSPDGTPPTPGDGEYSLKIVKTETGTGTRLEGALFEVKDPDARRWEHSPPSPGRDHYSSGAGRSVHHHRGAAPQRPT